jgi:hypothetical protein
MMSYLLYFSLVSDNLPQADTILAYTSAKGAKSFE